MNVDNINYNVHQHTKSDRRISHLLRRQDFLLPSTELSSQYTRWSTQSATIDGINVEGSMIDNVAVAVQLEESN